MSIFLSWASCSEIPVRDSRSRLGAGFTGVLEGPEVCGDLRSPDRTVAVGSRVESVTEVRSSEIGAYICTGPGRLRVGSADLDPAAGLGTSR